jgi:hypothetical protein
LRFKLLTQGIQILFVGGLLVGLEPPLKLGCDQPMPSAPQKEHAK